MKTYHLTHFDYYQIDTQLEGQYADLMKVWSHEEGDSYFYVAPKQIMAFLAKMKALETDRETIAMIKADYPDLQPAARAVSAAASDPETAYQAEKSAEREACLAAIDRNEYDFASRIKLAEIYLLSADIGNALEQYAFIVDNDDSAGSGIRGRYLSRAKLGVEQCQECSVSAKVEYPTAPIFTPESTHILKQFLEKNADRAAGPTPEEAAGKFVFHRAETEAGKDRTPTLPSSHK